jgi:hypothetical protein
MPILTEHCGEKRRRPTGLMLLAAIPLLVGLGLFAWSWYRPIHMKANGYLIYFGAAHEAQTSTPGLQPAPGGWVLVVNIPSLRAMYGAGWVKL